jgi:hypothetical protein
VLRSSVTGTAMAHQFRCDFDAMMAVVASTRQVNDSVSAPPPHGSVLRAGMGTLCIRTLEHCGRPEPSNRVTPMACEYLILVAIQLTDHVWRFRDQIIGDVPRNSPYAPPSFWR